MNKVEGLKQNFLRGGEPSTTALGATEMSGITSCAPPSNFMPRATVADKLSSYSTSLLPKSTSRAKLRLNQTAGGHAGEVL